METKSSGIFYNLHPYAMKKHDATSLHYDLRLELDGKLKSWVLPKGPSCHAGVLREAIEVEDHRSEYLLFEGVHETGTIMLWDKGTWEAHPESEDIRESLSKGILRFILHGEKLKGAWRLTRMSASNSTSRPVWHLCKEADSFADINADRCILEEQPNSITGKTMNDIEQDWYKPRDKHVGQSKLFD